MDIKELKFRIENNTLDDSPLVLKYSDNKFLSQQYVDMIAKNKKLEKLLINRLSDITFDEDLFDSESRYLYIYDVEKLSEDITPDIKNVVAICKEAPSTLSVDYVDMAKLIPWQIEDFVKMRLPGLTEQQIRWLCEVAKYDIYRLDNECKKLEIFSKESQKIIFDQMNSENAYCDLNSLTIYNFTNAVMKKDLTTIHAVLTDLKWIDIEGTGLITIFHKQFKNLIDIQFSPKATPEMLGMNPKQFNAIRYNVNKFSNSQLIEIYEFITGLDMRLKAGEFQFTLDNRENNNKFVEYITLGILKRSF